MYQIGELVVHRREGLSRITDIKKMSGREYYLLQAKRGNGELIYVPVDCSNTIIRPIMDIKSADDVLKYMNELKSDFGLNTKQRRDNFKRRLISGNIYDIAYLVRQLYLYHLLSNAGEVVHFGPTDIEMLTIAKNILFDELAHTYNLKLDDVGDFIIERVNSLS